jgi:hypothetical protein
LRSDEINERASAFDIPFHVDRQQVDYYRKTRKRDLDAISRISEQTALTEGYAVKEHRVYKLSMLAALMERDLLGGFLWTDEVKGIGSGDAAEIIDYEEFNSAEVVQYRGVLDDIAKEVGGRIQKTAISINYNELTDDQLLRIANGENPLHVIGTDSGAGYLGAAKETGGESPASPESENG